MRSIINILFLSSLLSSQLISLSHADTVYKVVDESGKVTYSSTPAVNHQHMSKIKITPPPTDEQIEAARQRHEKNQLAAEIMDENRQKRNKQTMEENRIKRKRQNQLQQQEQTEEANSNEPYNYPYYRRGIGTITKPDRPVARPPVQRPVRPGPR